MDEERNTPPTTTANAMLIQDDVSLTKDNISSDEDTTIEDNVYDFAFTCVGINIKIQVITTTQQIVLSQQSHGKKINENWVLLNSQSMINIFNNKLLFKSIRQCKKGESVRCFYNGGYQDTNEIGEVPGIGLVYYNPKSLANILSLSQIDSKYRVTYHSKAEKAFLVHGTNTGVKNSIEAKEDYISTMF